MIIERIYPSEFIEYQTNFQKSQLALPFLRVILRDGRAFYRRSKREPLGKSPYSSIPFI